MAALIQTGLPKQTGVNESSRMLYISLGTPIDTAYILFSWSNTVQARTVHANITNVVIAVACTSLTGLGLASCPLPVTGL